MSHYYFCPSVHLLYVFFVRFAHLFSFLRFLFLLFVFVLCLVYPMLPLSSPYLIAISDFSNVYLHFSQCLVFVCTFMHTELSGIVRKFKVIHVYIYTLTTESDIAFEIKQT